MGAFDWLTQGLSKAGDWLHQNIGKPLANGVEWVNQNVVKPVASVAKNIPGVSTAADLASRAGNVVTNVAQGAIGDKRKIDIAQAIDTGNEVYNAVKRRK